MKTDEIKKQDVIDQLVWDDRVNANDVMVHIEDGSVKLKGKVPNISAKYAAARDAYMVEGVISVDNQLEVEFPERETIPTDMEITSNVSNMLLWSDNVISSDIRVKTEDGVVTLSGSVNTYWEKMEAEDIAASALGVVDVINLLDVNLTGTFIDAEIETDIENAFRRSIIIDEKKVNVSVVNGVATLTGTVPTYQAKRVAGDIARYTAGVTDVINNLVVAF
jgi:osmotically-inducible protein OsmY